MRMARDEKAITETFTNYIQAFQTLEAWVDIDPAFAKALNGIAAGQEVILVTWLHQGRRDVLQVHPRDDPENPLKGVFATRSSDRPNPIGLHRVRVLEIAESVRLRVEPLEALDGTPVVERSTRVT